MPPLITVAKSNNRVRRGRATDLILYFGTDSSTLAELTVHSRQEHFGRLLDALATPDSSGYQTLKHHFESLSIHPVTYTPLENQKKIVAKLAKAGGAVVANQVVAQAATLADLHDLTRSVQPFGYSPSRIRPYKTGGGVRFAVLWESDRGPTYIKVGDRKAIEAANKKYSQDKLYACDVAGWLDDKGQEQFAAVWRHNVRPSKWVLGADVQQHQSLARSLSRRNYQPLTLQQYVGPGGNRICQVWQRTNGQSAFNILRASNSQLTVRRLQQQQFEKGSLVTRDISIGRTLRTTTADAWAKKTLESHRAKTKVNDWHLAAFAARLLNQHRPSCVATSHRTLTDSPETRPHRKNQRRIR